MEVGKPIVALLEVNTRLGGLTVGQVREQLAALPDGVSLADALFAKEPIEWNRIGIFQDVTYTIGNTPVVKVSDKVAPEGVEVYAKCEFFNPLASVKDRLALAIIEGAEKDGIDAAGDGQHRVFGV